VAGVGSERAVVDETRSPVDVKLATRAGVVGDTAVKGKATSRQEVSALG
jgi:hypothetical protein